MNTQVSTRATSPTDELARVTQVFTGELARVTQVFGDAPPRVTQLLGDIAVGVRRDRDPLRELIYALGDPYHPQYVEAVAALVVIGPRAVEELTAALSPAGSWLTAYRAAEALAQIGDGAAIGALIKALRHPNSNVRWNVVRALAAIEDPRSAWALRRVASQDRGKTGWGEPVAKTARVALQRLEARSTLPRIADLIKTAFFVVIMFGALLLATTHLKAMRAELRRDVPARAWVASVATTGTPDVLTATGNCPVSSPARPASRTATPVPEITGQVLVPALPVRDRPRLDKNQVGVVHAGDSLIILEQCGNWYRVRLGDTKAAMSQIQGGEGWIARIVVGPRGPAAPPVQAAIQR